MPLPTLPSTTRHYNQYFEPNTRKPKKKQKKCFLFFCFAYEKHCTLTMAVARQIRHRSRRRCSKVHSGTQCAVQISNTMIESFTNDNRCRIFSTAMKQPIVFFFNEILEFLFFSNRNRFCLHSLVDLAVIFRDNFGTFQIKPSPQRSILFFRILNIELKKQTNKQKHRTKYLIAKYLLDDGVWCADAKLREHCLPLVRSTRHIHQTIQEQIEKKSNAQKRANA